MAASAGLDEPHILPIVKDRAGWSGMAGSRLPSGRLCLAGDLVLAGIARDKDSPAISGRGRCYSSHGLRDLRRDAPIIHARTDGRPHGRAGGYGRGSRGSRTLVLGHLPKRPSRSWNLAYSSRKASLTVPVGPFRCLLIMTSAIPWSSVSGL